MSQRTPLIGFAGLARSGKDTAGRYLCERYGFERVAFADPLKEGIAAMLGMPVALMDGLKDVPVPGLSVTPRQMMQYAGTEGLRALSPNLHVLLLERRIAQRHRGARGIVVTDVRMRNEADWTRAHGLLVHIERAPVSHIPTHASEAGVERKEGDLWVSNKSTINVLHHRLDAMIAESFPHLIRAPA